MSARESVNTAGFAHVNPVPVASRIGRFLQSGVLTGRDLATRRFPESLDEQARIVFERITELVAAAGGSPADILKVTLWVERYRDRDAINREWQAMFPDPASRPARQIIKAALDEGALLQADIVAVLPENAGSAAGPAAQRTPDSAARSDAAAESSVLTPELKARLLSVGVATLSAQLRRRGHVNVFIEGALPNKPGAHIAGVAKTLRLIPFRPDLFASHGGGYNAQKRAFDSVQPGEVIVIEARGERGSGTLGDVLALRAQHLGAEGVVTDGGVRDYETVAGFDLPVFSRGPNPSVLGRLHVPWEADVTIACGGAAVQPGDVIVGDGDGVIVIPRFLAEEVAADAVAQEEEDAWVAEQVRRGEKVDGLFPPNAEWKARYLAEKKQGAAEEGDAR